MTRLIKICIFVLCLIILTSATPFLKTLLTTSTPTTHISDFRNLPRSDSRADKPDIFPGFDFLDEPTTVRMRTPLDLYTKFIGRIINQGRQRYEQIVNNVQQYQIDRHRNSAQKLVYIPVERTEDFTQPTSFDELTLDDDDKFETVKRSKEQNFAKKYFSSILTAIGLNKLRNASDPEYSSKILATSATYINPLVQIWRTASRKLNFEHDTTEQVDNKSTNVEINSNVSHLSSSPFEFNENIKPTTVVSSSSPLPFPNEFSKYLNFISKGYRNNDENKTMSVHTQLSDIPLGDVNLNNNNTIGVDVDFPIERIDEQNDETEDDNDESNENSNYDASNVGIFILEIFGTIVGLTWGAYSQLQHFFTQNGK